MFGFQRRFVRRWEWLTAYAEARLLAADVADRCHKGSDATSGRLDRRPSGRAYDPPPMATLERLDAAAVRAARARLPGRPRRPPRGHQPAERLPGPRRRHRHEHGPHARLGVRGARRRRTTTWPRRARPISHGSLMGARGNSGVILSQILRGLAEVLRDGDAAGPAEVAAALEQASTAAYGAVMKPVEGTILTVVREASEAAAERAGDGGVARRRARRRPRPGRRRPRPHARDAAGAGPGRRRRRRRQRLPAAARRRCSHVVDGRADARARRSAPRRRRSTCADGARRRPRRHRRPALRGHVLPRGDRRGHPRASRTCGPASATRSSSSAATASGTATSTPTTSAPPSRPAIDAGRPRRIRVTDLLEQVGGGAVGARGRRRRARVARHRRAVHHRGRRRRRRRRRAAALPQPRRPADRHRRPDDEPVDRRPPRRRRGVPGRRRS